MVINLTHRPSSFGQVLVFRNFDRAGGDNLQSGWYGNFDTMLDHFPRGSQLLCHPTRWRTCPTECPCLLPGAGWCLQSDAVPVSRRFRHTGETVLCHRKIVLSIGLYRKDRLNHFDRKLGYFCTTPAVTDEIKTELPAELSALLAGEMPPGPKKDYRPPASAIEAMRWTTDDNQLPPGTRRVYPSKVRRF